MNTPGEFCLPSGIHKVVSIPLWWIYLGISSPGKSRLPGLYDTSIIISLQKMPGVWYSRESRLHSIFIKGEFWLPRVGIWHRQVFLQTSWVGYSVYSSLGSLELSWLLFVFFPWGSRLPGWIHQGVTWIHGVEHTRVSRIPDGEYTGDSITNTNNSTNIRQSSKSFWAMSKGTRKGLCDGKKRRWKI
jgi:hypothetical protein